MAAVEVRGTYPMRRSAFTLIELLVVIAIIAILAAILFPVFAQAKAAAKKTGCLSNIKQMSTAAQLYLGDNDDTYPLSSYSAPSSLSSFSNTYYWYMGLVFTSSSVAVLDAKYGVLYPYQKNGPIVTCPSATNIKPSTGGAPFTIDPTNAPLGYDVNLFVSSKLNTNSSWTAYYGPFSGATQWDEPANSLLIADSAWASSSASDYTVPVTASFNGIYPPRRLYGTAKNSANVQGRHANVTANASFQDTHAKSVKVSQSLVTNSTYSNALSDGIGYILGPGTSKPTDIGANYYFVPDKSTSNPYL